MIDHMDGTVTYSKKEIDNINSFLKKIFDAVTDYENTKDEELL